MAKIFCYAQGFSLLREASSQYEWGLDCGSIALLWRGGCIIRSSFLEKIKEAFVRNPKVQLLITDPYFADQVKESIPALRAVIAKGVAGGIAMPCLSAALAWYDSVRCIRLPTNLIQAQRDLFGAHMFERVDAPRGTMFHIDWNV